MHEILNLNAASVSTNLGCGTLGHLCITLSPTVYATLLTTRVLPPLNTGTTPVIPAVATDPKVASIRYAHDAAMLAFNTFLNVDRALRQQLLGSVKDIFLQVKHNPHPGYSGSRTLDLLTHIYETHAVISNADWLANENRFRKPYYTTVPIKVACQKIDNAVAYTNS